MTLAAIPPGFGLGFTVGALAGIALCLFLAAWSFR